MLPLMYVCDIMSCEEDATVALALVRTMCMSREEMFSLTL